MASGFQNSEMGDAVAVGSVRSDGARLWMRARTPGAYVVTWSPKANSREERSRQVEISNDEANDFTSSVGIPGDHSKLRPMTRYRFRITSRDGGRVLGEGRFETAPAGADVAPSVFSFAVMSCNQPFDAHGAVREDARQMLRAASGALEEHDCKFIVMMGDQLYSDMPTKLSLFDPDYFKRVGPAGRDRIHDCTTAEVRRLYQQRYRHFGNISELRDLLRGFPTYTIIDDHDIVDNWGSDPAHQTATWRSIGEGARWAYYDYQAAHLMPRSNELPASFQYDFSYGPISVFVMDLRSERWVDGDEGRLFSGAQQDALDAFLERNGDQKALFSC